MRRNRMGQVHPSALSRRPFPRIGFIHDITIAAGRGTITVDALPAASVMVVPGPRVQVSRTPCTRQQSSAPQAYPDLAEDARDTATTLPKASR
jgi:hypothetical protein